MVSSSSIADLNGNIIGNFNDTQGNNIHSLHTILHNECAQQAQCLHPTIFSVTNMWEAPVSNMAIALCWFIRTSMFIRGVTGVDLIAFITMGFTLTKGSYIQHDHILSDKYVGGPYIQHDHCPMLIHMNLHVHQGATMVDLIVFITFTMTRGSSFPP